VGARGPQHISKIYNVLKIENLCMKRQAIYNQHRCIHEQFNSEVKPYGVA